MPGYSNIVIYYFTGTGNALQASRWISEKANGMGINSKLITIDRLKAVEQPKNEGNTLLGFSSPTHGFNLPWIMLKFIFKFPVSKGEDVFLLNTRAGMKMGKLFLPGLSGLAQLLPMLILRLKGYKIKGLLPMDLPSNWVSVHPGLKQKVVESIFEKRKKETDFFTKQIITGKSYYPIKFFLALPFDLLVSPIAFLYFIYGRFFLSKTFIASADCNNCRLCEQKCPTESVVIIKNRPYWRFTCESCMRCINICPQKSIQSSHSLATIMIYLTSSIPVFIWLSKSIDHLTSGLNDHMLTILLFPFQWSIKIISFYLIYLVFFALLKVKIINRFFEFTSLTRFWRRYKAPGIKASDFNIPKTE
jgi:Pyruvate/2-oxoacid:ferredoxin oxidoreductase delta subunit